MDPSPSATSSCKQVTRKGLHIHVKKQGSLSWLMAALGVIEFTTSSAADAHLQLPSCSETLLLASLLFQPLASRGQARGVVLTGSGKLIELRQATAPCGLWRIIGPWEQHIQLVSASLQLQLGRGKSRASESTYRCPLRGRETENCS